MPNLHQWTVNKRLFGGLTYGHRCTKCLAVSKEPHQGWECPGAVEEEPTEASTASAEPSSVCRTGDDTAELCHDPKYSAEHDNYYCKRCQKGMGNDYYKVAKRLEAEEAATLKAIEQRDYAQDRLDIMTSAILGEDVDWSCHEAKWEEAANELPGILHDAELYREREKATEAVSDVSALRGNDAVGQDRRSEGVAAELVKCDTCNDTGETMLMVCYGGMPAEQMGPCPDCVDRKPAPQKQAEAAK